MLRIQQCLASGIVVVGVSALVVSSAEPRDIFRRTEQPPVALTAQVQPLPTPALAPTTVVPTAPLDLLGRQVNFHVGLLVDFVVTGAQLIARQVPVPGRLLEDIQNGVPLPVAVGRALQTLVDVELDAGRELVGFAAEYIDFQVRFLADLIALPFAVVAAVGEAVGSFFAAVAPAPVAQIAEVAEVAEVAEPSVATQAVAVSAEPAVARLADSTLKTVEAEPADTAATVEDVKVADEPTKPTTVVTAPDSDTVTTVSTQGEVRSGATDTTDTTDTTDVDDPTTTVRDDAPEADARRRRETQ